MRRRDASYETSKLEKKKMITDDAAQLRRIALP
jgi:hypothetical protein